MELVNFYSRLCLAFMVIRFGQSTFKMIQDEQEDITEAEGIEKVISNCNESMICKAVEDFALDAICGSDGRTYSNRCELKKAHCYGNFVSEQHKGACSEKLKCLLNRSHQLATQIWTNSTDHFVPECEPDGTYSAIQCHNSTGYCWCSTSAGMPVAGTTVRNKRPYCPPHGKVGRRSSRRRVSKNGCTTLDRSAFNYNLIRFFRQEFEEEAKRKNQPIGLIATKQVIEWKFSKMDSDRNGKISIREIRSVKKLAKDFIGPRVCARRLWGHCDSDHDSRITKPEWFLCLGVDINVSLRLLHSLNPGRKKSTQSPRNKPTRARSFGGSRQRNSLLALTSGLASADDRRGRFLLSEKPSVSNNNEDNQEEDKASPPDCSIHRKRSLEEYRADPSGSIYVPVCSSPNVTLYDPVQCHSSTGFCWCVEALGGKPIPGTSLQNMRPICGPNAGSLKRLGDMKDCVGKKKRLFFTRLLATMESNMIARGGDTSDDEKSRGETVAYWQFRFIDKNNNTRIDRSEWKEYRNTLKTWIGVKKCGRNFLRYCDDNKDRRISLQEWLECTLRNFQAMSDSSPAQSKLNPFVSLLKSEP